MGTITHFETPHCAVYVDDEMDTIPFFSLSVFTEFYITKDVSLVRVDKQHEDLTDAGCKTMVMTMLTGM